MLRLLTQLSLIPVMLLSSLELNAQDGRACGYAFRETSGQNSEPQSNAPASNQLYSHYSTRNLQVIDIRSGRHGGQRLVVQRNGPWFDWNKELREKVGDIVPDLRFHSLLMGAQEAAYFGYELLDDNTITLPDVTELRGAIHKFNETLPESDPRRILMKPYATPQVTNPVLEYVSRFANNLEFPVSQSRKGFYHDTGTHALEGFMIDNELALSIQSRTRALLQFIEYLRLAPETPAIRPKLYKAVTKRLRRDLVAAIDQVGAIGHQFVEPSQRTYLGTIGLDQLRGVIDSPGMSELFPSVAGPLRSGEPYLGAEGQHFLKKGALPGLAITRFDLLKPNKLSDYLQRKFEYVCSVDPSQIMNQSSDDLQVLNQIKERFFAEHPELEHGSYNVQQLSDDISTYELHTSPTLSRTQRILNWGRSLFPRRAPEGEPLTEWEQVLASRPTGRIYIDRVQHLRRLLRGQP